MDTILISGKIKPNTSRKKRIEILKKVFYEYLCEDPIDGTPFDGDFTDFFLKMEKKYENQ
ncbi:MAG: hypothetical protein V1686_00745 [Patescibacteria group bacterium]